MDNQFMNWISTKTIKITSLILWNKEYEPYQTIILREDRKTDLKVIYYFQLDDKVVAFQQTIHGFRTATEEERLFQISRIGLLLLGKALGEEEELPSTSNEDPLTDKRLNDLLEEAFLSRLAIDLMRTRSPDFGFYSFSPNMKKIEKMIHGEDYHLLNLILRKK
jgi:hypothetical protein